MPTQESELLEAAEHKNGDWALRIWRMNMLGRIAVRTAVSGMHNKMHTAATIGLSSDIGGHSLPNGSSSGLLIELMELIELIEIQTVHTSHSRFSASLQRHERRHKRRAMNVNTDVDTDRKAWRKSRDLLALFWGVYFSMCVKQEKNMKTAPHDCPSRFSRVAFGSLLFLE